MQIKIDPELCVSVGSCVAIAGQTFELDENGIAQVKSGNLDAEATIIAAAESCPTKAITLLDDDGNQIYPQP
ncbi:MAG: ferredoxin [Candidatus Komeilibacteria bacterium]